MTFIKVDWRGAGRPKPGKKDPDDTLHEEIFIVAMADFIQSRGGNGAELKGNAIENKGNTTDRQPSIPLGNQFSPSISAIRATPAGIKRATHAWRFFL